MFPSDAPGRSIFCDIHQNPSPLFHHVDLGKGLTAIYDPNIGQWRIVHSSGSEETPTNLVPFISWKTRLVVHLTTANQFWALACDGGSLEKIDGLLRAKLETVSWIKLNKKFFLFFNGIEDKLKSGAYGTMQVYMPSDSQSIEIKIDPISTGGNLYQIPECAPAEFVDYLINIKGNKTDYLSQNFNRRRRHLYQCISDIRQWVTIEPEDRNKYIEQSQKQSIPSLKESGNQPMRRLSQLTASCLAPTRKPFGNKHLPLKKGMTVDNKRMGYEDDSPVPITKEDCNNTRAVVRELIKQGLHVGFRHPSKKWFYFKEEISGLKWGATDDELTLCYFLEENPAGEPLYRTGERFQIVVVDADVKQDIDGIKNFIKLCVKNEFDPYKTRIVLTPSGGLHFIFIYPAGYDIRCSTSKIAEGVDIRANDGVAGAPGYIRRFGRGAGNAYMTIHNVPPIPYPDFLIELTRKQEPIIKQPNPRNFNSKPAVSHPPCVSTDAGDMAALDELAMAAHIVAMTDEGSRNTTLYKKSFRLGLLVAEGRLSEELVITRFQQAAKKCGLDEGGIMPTIRSGLNGAYEYKSPSHK